MKHSSCVVPNYLLLTIELRLRAQLGTAFISYSAHRTPVTPAKPCLHQNLSLTGLQQFSYISAVPGIVKRETPACTRNYEILRTVRSGRCPRPQSVPVRSFISFIKWGRQQSRTGSRSAHHTASTRCHDPLLSQGDQDGSLSLDSSAPLPASNAADAKKFPQVTPTDLDPA
jgi:hypothetical protein